MSYVKVGAIYKKEFHIFEVYGGELRLDVTMDWDYLNDKPIIIPTFSSGDDYERWCKENDQIVNGITKDRFDIGIPKIQNDEDKEKFFQYLKEHDIRDWSDDNPRGYKYNSIIDLDNNVFLSMFENWYNDYSKYLPDGWLYMEIPATIMNIIKYEPARPDYEQMIKSKRQHRVRNPVILYKQIRRPSILIEVEDIEEDCEKVYFLACSKHRQRIAFTDYYATKELAEDALRPRRNWWYCFTY